MKYLVHEYNTENALPIECIRFDHNRSTVVFYEVSTTAPKKLQVKAIFSLRKVWVERVDN